MDATLPPEHPPLESIMSSGGYRGLGLVRRQRGQKTERQNTIRPNGRSLLLPHHSSIFFSSRYMDGGWRVEEEE